MSTTVRRRDSRDRNNKWSHSDQVFPTKPCPPFRCKACRSRHSYPSIMAMKGNDVLQPMYNECITPLWSFMVRCVPLERSRLVRVILKGNERNKDLQSFDFDFFVIFKASHHWSFSLLCKRSKPHQSHLSHQPHQPYKTKDSKNLQSTWHLLKAPILRLYNSMLGSCCATSPANSR